MSQYFPKPYEPFGGDIKVKVELSNYATKTYLKNVSHADVSSFALKSNLASLKIKTNQEEFKIEKVIKKKRNKLYVKWKGYDNSFNSWNDKKDLVKGIY